MYVYMYVFVYLFISKYINYVILLFLGKWFIFIKGSYMFVIGVVSRFFR